MTTRPDLAELRARAGRAAEDVEGWLSDAQGRALFDAAARATGRGAIVEIGSWKGRSTVWLAHGARAAGQRVYAVDRHERSHEDPAARTFDVFQSNLRRAGIEAAVTPLVMSSADAAQHLDVGVEVLFIDGDHTDAGTKADADIWLPRLVDGGTLLMHDVVTVSYTGPLRVFRRQVCWSGGYAGIRRVGSMGVARRAFRNGPLTIVWGWLAGLLLYAVDVKRAMRKVRRA